jgi:hypothetical protein
MRTTDGAFHVVSSGKLLALFFLTFGMYQLVWFYQHWATHKRRTHADIWPLPRAIFSVFTAHSLFSTFALAGALRGRRFDANMNATVFVVLSIISMVIGRVGDKVSQEFNPMDAAGIAIGLATVVPVFAAQRAANIAAGDEQGESNSSFTLGNYLWCALCLGLLLLIVVGTFMPAEV